MYHPCTCCVENHSCRRVCARAKLHYACRPPGSPSSVSLMRVSLLVDLQSQFFGRPKAHPVTHSLASFLHSRPSQSGDNHAALCRVLTALYPPPLSLTLLATRGNPTNGGEVGQTISNRSCCVAWLVNLLNACAGSETNRARRHLQPE